MALPAQSSVHKTGGLGKSYSKRRGVEVNCVSSTEGRMSAVKVDCGNVRNRVAGEVGCKVVTGLEGTAEKLAVEVAI